MKKTLFLSLAALAALCGCQKGTEAAPGGLTFTSEVPETRTAWTGETIEWSKGDAISMAYTVDGTWMGPSLYRSTPLSEGGTTAHFTVPGNFSSGSGTAHRFYAFFPALAETDFSDAPDIYTTVPEIQAPTSTSYDPSADLLSGISRDTYSSLPTEAVPLKWTRLTAHGDITLKGLELAEDETVKSIVLQGQNGAELTGNAIVDLANPEDYATDGKPRVTIAADNLTLGADGSIHFWVSIFPVTLTELTVSVTTDQATYRKTFTGISKTFTRNARNILGVNMKGAEKSGGAAPAGEYYVKVTSAPTDWTGDYLIVYEADKLVLDSDGDAKTHASVSIDEDKISYETAKAYNIRIEKSGSGYSMKMGDNYLGLNSGSKNALNTSTSEPTDGYRWTFQTTDGTIRAYNLGFSTRFLQYNAGSGQFRCYTSAQKEVAFFKLDGEAGGGGTTPTPVAPSVTTGGSANVSQTEATLSASYTGTPTYGGFEWGLSADALTEDWQAPYLNGGAFSATIEGLGAGHTYYYRTYIAVLEGTEYKYYYGEVRSFTTPASEIVIGGDQPGWYETPTMNIKKSGN
ncbi:MAG: hypothetical protein IKH49_08780, partial [Bacteroidales bacterium]|nr:hypothetical protein [Bacteroidales bacterium]